MIITSNGSVAGTTAADKSGNTVFLNYYTLEGKVYATNRNTGTVTVKDSSNKNVNVTVSSVVSAASFYDAREKKTMVSLDVNVGNLATASTAKYTDTYSGGSSTVAAVTTPQYNILPSNGIVYVNNTAYESQYSDVNQTNYGASYSTSTDYTGVVRLTNATALPVPKDSSGNEITGLSFISDDAMFVKGDYNTSLASTRTGTDLPLSMVGWGCYLPVVQ